MEASRLELASKAVRLATNVKTKRTDHHDAGTEPAIAQEPFKRKREDNDNEILVTKKSKTEDDISSSDRALNLKEKLKGFQAPNMKGRDSPKHSN